MSFVLGGIRESADYMAKHVQLQAFLAFSPDTNCKPL